MNNENEFESLIDIVLARGAKYSELISTIQETILKEYIVRYPKETKDVEILINEKTGNVRLLSNKTDVTPSDFVLIAEKIARQVLIQKLKESENKEIQFSQQKSSGWLSKWLVYYLFYVYNAIYFIFIFLQAFNFFLNGEFRADIIKNFEEMGLLKEIVMLALLVIPFISIAIAYKAKFLKKSPQLARLTFSFEIPLIILFIIALSFKEKAPIMWFLWLMAFFAVIDFFLEFIKTNASSSVGRWFTVVSRQFALMTAAYLVVLYLFYFPIIIFSILFNLDIGMIMSIIVSIIGIIFASIFVIILFSPFLILNFLFKRHFKLCKSLTEQVGKKQMIMAHLAIAFVWIIVLCAISYQSGEGLYVEKLKRISSTQTFEEKEIIARELVSKEKIIKQEMENISNARERYPIDKDYDGLKEAYKDVFNFSDGMAGFVQSAFTGLAYPFVYRGVFDEEVPLENYEYLFGHSLDDYDYNPSLINNVNLVSRTTRAATDYQGLLATISIEEEYENTSWGNQEVVYEFSLPQNSAIIDLKLGPNLEYSGVIAPRGAAGKVYQQELTRRKDPALLEQTGPRQYRLRVFPIPGENDKTTLNGKNQKVKFSYVAELTSQGYPLPIYSKKQNVKIDKTKTYYYIDNEKIASNIDDLFIKSASTQNIPNLCNLSSPITLKTPQAENVSAQLVPYNSINGIRDIYKCDKDSGIDLTKSLKGSKFAILYDVSSGNKGNSFLDDLTKTLLSEKTLLQNNTIDLYLFNDALSQKKRVTSDWIGSFKDVVYFGKSDWVNAINKLDAQYDFIIIAASDSDMPKGESGLDIKNKSSLYIIHKDNKASAYPAKVSNTIMQNGGEVASSFKDALTQYALKRQLRSRDQINYLAYSSFWGVEVSDSSQPFTSYLDRYISNTTPDVKTSLIINALNNFHQTQEGDPMSYIVNKSYLSYLLSFYQGNLESNLTLLDSSNNFAKNSHFVSPFSSLIALVNEQQQANLEDASQEQDRYSYEVPESRNNTVFCDPSSSVFCNPISSSDGIPGWSSSVNRPEGVPTDLQSSTLHIGNWILGFIAINLVAIIFMGIVEYLTARRNENSKKDARKIIFWGIVSMLIIMLVNVMIGIVLY